MSDYLPPLNDMSFLIQDVLNLNTISTLPGYQEATPDLVEAVLDEGGRYFSAVIAPTNQLADNEGCRVEGNRVLTAQSLDGLFDTYREGGWPTLTGDSQFGGQGLPHVLGGAIDEMFQSANLGFSLLPLLTAGVITALDKFGSDVQKSQYLPRLISGEWSGTMNLTEAQAGSDLAAVRCKAVPRGDDYLISGQKVFISWGDHDFVENIVHLVLARTPDAPEGVRGISLFIVPKFLVDQEGKIAQRNDVYPASVEHKMGIHASPTCVMSFGETGGAVGYLVGEENHGLSYMFAMMNHARLSVGLQGVSVGERAYQHAVKFAREREQGSVAGLPGRATIIHYPDVRRMLMLMRSLTEAGRALSYSAFAHWDHASHEQDEAVRAYHQRRVDILTPLVKAWCTEAGNEVAYLGVQIHGGMGFIEESGVAQYMRDVRIAPIYEGTNGIQALDFVGRKVLRDNGVAARELLADLRLVLSPLACGDDGDKKRSENYSDEMNSAVAETLDVCDRALNLLFDKAADKPDFAGAVAFNFLLLFGTAVAASLMLKSATIAEAQLKEGAGKAGFLNTKIKTTRFFIEQVLPRTESYMRIIQAGDDATMALTVEEF